MLHSMHTHAVDSLSRSQSVDTSSYLIVTNADHKEKGITSPSISSLKKSSSSSTINNNSLRQYKLNLLDENTAVSHYLEDYKPETSHADTQTDDLPQQNPVASPTKVDASTQHDRKQENASTQTKERLQTTHHSGNTTSQQNPVTPQIKPEPSVTYHTTNHHHHTHHTTHTPLSIDSTSSTGKDPKQTIHKSQNKTEKKDMMDFFYTLWNQVQEFIKKSPKTSNKKEDETMKNTKRSLKTTENTTEKIQDVKKPLSIQASLNTWFSPIYALYQDVQKFIQRTKTPSLSQELHDPYSKPLRYRNLFMDEKTNLSPSRTRRFHLAGKYAFKRQSSVLNRSRRLAVRTKTIRYNYTHDRENVRGYGRTSKRWDREAFVMA